jgi:hypothetical protein
LAKSLEKMENEVNQEEWPLNQLRKEKTSNEETKQKLIQQELTKEIHFWKRIAVSNKKSCERYKFEYENLKLKKGLKEQENEYWREENETKLFTIESINEKYLDILSKFEMVLIENNELKTLANRLKLELNNSQNNIKNH